MKPMHVCKQLGKFVMAACIAAVFLTGFCFLYYNVPVHSEAEDGVTNYRWEKNVFYLEATEGLGWGKTNNEGYMNSFDYKDGDQVDVLLMGSSHMEGKQVPMSRLTSSRLNAMLTNKTVYNIGISGHDFLVCCGNLAAAVDKYQPSDYVIIETATLGFTEAQEEAVLSNEEAPYEAHTGIVGVLQQNPFFRWSYTQLEKFMERLDWPFDNKLKPIIEVQKDTDRNETSSHLQAPDRLLSNISQLVAEKTGATVIIVYHPGTWINQDGTLHLSIDGARDEFRALCEENGIIFLDMSERFAVEYENHHILPHGFANSSVGSGHLNQYGHAMIADELYRIMRGEVG